MICFKYRPFSELTLRELYDVLHLRDEVFVVGQKITAECEVDGLDPECGHILGSTEDDRIVATARLFMAKDPIIVGRVAVHPDFRRQGLGAAVMRFAHEIIGQRPAALSAQAHLQAWYEGLGWVASGPVYIEAEIPHIHMDRR